MAKKPSRAAEPSKATEHSQVEGDQAAGDQASEPTGDYRGTVIQLQRLVHGLTPGNILTAEQHTQLMEISNQLKLHADNASVNL